jgi:glycosyltransferase involved in cell wall biosynthesis
MKILIVGNDPNEIGGVANYTRPLVLELTEMGHSVHYFYSGAWNRDYDSRFIPYIRHGFFREKIHTATLVNSPCFSVNYGFPDIDIEEKGTERLFERYLRELQPDVMHVHSRMGLPSSIFRIAKSQGIKVFNTIHVYGMLCQKRVMIDRSGEPCPGPVDLAKCAWCTGRLNIPLLKLRARLEKILPGINRRMSKARHSVAPKGGADNSSLAAVSCDQRVADALKRRLDAMIGAMNQWTDCTTCVSSDVKDTLVKFGANPQKLRVQHIGSLIAEKQQDNKRPLHSPLVVGNIGGVNHYKGTQVLIDAVRIIKRNDYVVKIFGKYDPQFVESICQGAAPANVQFLGRYVPEELPGILEQIDVMVLPSICNDTAPQTIFESYSNKIPIIAPRIGGFPDFVVDGVNGALFQAGDSKDLARKINDILDAPDHMLDFRRQIPNLKTIRENALELIAMYSQEHSCHV